MRSHVFLTSNRVAALARSGERTTTQVSKFFEVRAVGATQKKCAIMPVCHVLWG